MSAWSSPRTRDRQPARRYVPLSMPCRGGRSYSVVADPDDQRRVGIPGLLRADGVNRRRCSQLGSVRGRPTDAALDSARRRSAVPVVRASILGQLAGAPCLDGADRVDRHQDPGSRLWITAVEPRPVGGETHCHALAPELGKILPLATKPVALVRRERPQSGRSRIPRFRVSVPVSTPGASARQY